MIMCGNCKKIGHLTRDCMVTVTTNTQGAVVENQQGIGCYEYERPRHFRKDYPKLRNQNRRNQTRNKSGNKTGNKTGELDKEVLVADKMKAVVGHSFRRLVRTGSEHQQMVDLNSLLESVSLSQSHDKWFCNLTGDGEFRVKERLDKTLHWSGVGAAPLMSPRQDETSEPLLYARWMADPYRVEDATRGRNDDPVTSGIRARFDRGGPKQNRSSCSLKKFSKVLAAQWWWE
nr:RNA-directed DNA polymerase, eukaryota [Tanacetum cinerariifolium]